MSTPDDRLKEVAVAKAIGMTCERELVGLAGKGGWVLKYRNGDPCGAYGTEENVWQRFAPHFLTDPAASDLILDYCDQQGWRTEEYSYPSLKQVQCVINFSPKSADTRYRARVEAILAACAATGKDAPT